MKSLLLKRMFLRTEAGVNTARGRADGARQISGAPAILAHGRAQGESDMRSRRFSERATSARAALFKWGKVPMGMREQRDRTRRLQRKKKKLTTGEAMSHPSPTSFITPVAWRTGAETFQGVKTYPLHVTSRPSCAGASHLGMRAVASSAQLQ
ncbi:hypothetical protein B0H19DRAFT_1072117 [Mycena capillaripes]|nr:hypothetical protein B0H19DRAFT_1072117 [Mycena capillaripes]